MEAYQKVQEFDLSSGADWKTTAKHKESLDKSACKALDDVFTFNNCTRVWSVGEDITMIVFSDFSLTMEAMKLVMSIRCLGQIAAIQG